MIHTHIYIYIYSPNDQQQRVNCHGLEILHNKLSDFARISHCIMFPLYAHYITTISAWFVGKVAHGYKLHHRKSHYQNKVGWDTMLIFQLYSYYIYIYTYIYIQGFYAYVITIAIHSPSFFFFAGQVGEASCSDHRPGCCRDVQCSRSCGALYWWHPHHHGAWGEVSYVFHRLEGEKHKWEIHHNKMVWKLVFLELGPSWV